MIGQINEKVDQEILRGLMAKLSDVKRIGEEKKVDVSAAEKEIARQIGQVLRGEPVTKSGPAD